MKLRLAAGAAAVEASPLVFLGLWEQGLDTLTVLWQSALNRALFSVPDRLLVLDPVSQELHAPNLYLQSPENKKIQLPTQSVLAITV